jgi:hypothetical protein
MPRKASVAAPAPTRPVIKPRVPFFSQPPVVMAVLISMVVFTLWLWMTGVTPVPTIATSIPYASVLPTRAQSVTERVNRFIVTNPNEAPQVFTVSDPASFNGRLPLPSGLAILQGDKVLIWADKTVVYSPSLDKLVAVFPTAPGQSYGQPDQTAPETPTAAPVDHTPEQAATIEIRNGSGVNGAAARMRTTLKGAGLTVLGVGDAKTKPQGTIVVDLSQGKYPNALEKTITTIGGTSAGMPLGEPSSDASILVIIGK